MVAGTPISGKEGKVLYTTGDTELEITDWNASGDADLHSYATSLTAGFKKTISGNKILTGTVSGVIVTGQVPDTLFEEGDTVALKLVLSNTGGSDFGIVVASALIGNVKYAVNVGTGEPEAFTFDFTSDGTYTYGTVV